MRSAAALAALVIGAGWWHGATDATALERVGRERDTVVRATRPPRDTGGATLPAPRGPHRVGTMSFVIRRTASTVLQHRRPMVVTVWYPTADSASFRRAPYLREEGAIRALASTDNAQATRLLALRDVATHAWLDAPVLRRAGRLPVVLFSHGYLAMPGDYTALMEELASQGFAVFSMAHTGETMAVTLPPNQVALAAFPDGELTDPAASVLREWFDEDEVSAAVSGAASRGEAERLLRRYLERIPQSTTALDRWVQDTRDLLDALQKPVLGSPAARFGAMLDLTRVAAAGHAMGGVSSIAFCARDPRCTAAINLDGSPQYGDLIDHPSPSPVLMVYSARAGRAGVSDAIYARGREYWRADLAGSLHANFGDWQFLATDSTTASALGPIPAQRAHDAVAVLLNEFLRAKLLRTHSPLFAGQRSVPDLTLRRIVR